MRRAERLLRCLCAGLLALAALAGAVVMHPSMPAAEAAIPANDLYTWGSRPGGTNSFTYGTPVRASGTVSTGNTTSSNPGGGGTLNALLSSSSPVNKLSVLKAFGGGTLKSVVETARTRTMYAAVESPSGTDQLWYWSTSYLNPTLFWTASSGEDIIKISAYRDQNNLQAQGMITEKNGERRVYTWGSNNGSWTGLNTATGTTASPTEISSLRGLGMRDIAVGYLSMAAVDGDGDVWVWGADNYSQLGLATSTTQAVPVELTASNVAGGGSAPSDVVEIDMGHIGTIARTASQVWSWGYNTTYAGHSNPTYPAIVSLNTCTPTSTSWSVYVSGSSVYSSVYAGCSQGGVRSWGNNNYGQLGDNSTTSRTSPVSVQGLPSGVAVSQVEGGAAAGMARLSSGDVYAWGSNLYRQLGITTNYSSGVANYKTAQLSSRVAVPGPATLSSIWATEFTGGAIASTGVMYTWGNAAAGLLGRGTKGPSANTTGAAFDRLGVVDGTGVDLIDSTDRGTVMVLSDGSVWTWGYNDVNNWNNGDGGSGSRLWPGKIDLPFGPGTATPSEEIERLACGANHCLVATSDGRIFGWGDQSYKQIVPTAATAANAYNTPTLVVDLASVPRIAAGRYFSLYVEAGSSGGTVNGWGYNSHREAAPNGAVTTALTAFVPVTDFTDVIDVSAGWYHSSVLRANGSVVVWGSNGGYEYGDGSKTTAAPYYSTRTLPTGQTPESVHAAGRATFVRTASGKLFAWGTNNYGFMGTGATASLTTPTSVATSITNSGSIVAFDVFISQVTTSVFYTALSVAIDDTGNVWSWGGNAYGQLGADIAAATSGANLYKSSPQRVKTSTGDQLSAGTRAIAGSGWGATYTPVTAGLAPSAPTAVSATPGNGEVNVSWTAPTSPRDLRSYTVIARNSSETAIVARTGATAASTTATVTGLTNGTSYSFRVIATNEFGNSDESSPAATATPLSVPSIPQSLVVAPGASGVSATWSAPSDIGGSAILDYTATLTPTLGGAPTVQTVAAGGSPSVAFAGLTPGTSYSLAVTARNSQGSSLAATETVVIVGRPTAPQDVEASARMGEAVVSWSAPSSDGGAPIASYYVRAYSTGTTSMQASSVVTSGMSTTLTGLTDGTTYDITVTAAQDSATPPTSLGVESAIAQVTPGRPSAPTDVVATPGAGQVTATWDAVSDVPGISVTGYTLAAVVGATTTTANIATSACAGGTCTGTVSGLTNGTAYDIKVAANSSSGAGPYSSSVSSTPRTTPSAPQSLSVTVLDGGVDVAWAAPASTGGSALTSYTVSVLNGATTVYTGLVDASLETESVSGLDNGVTYTVSVVATNAAGSGPSASTSSTPLGPPSVPLGLTLTPGASSFTATWTAPTSTGGSAITSYTLTVTDPQGVSTVLTTSGAGSCVTSTRTCSVTQVDDGTETGTLTPISDDTRYVVSVLASNAQGDGPSTSDSTVIPGQPSAPRNVITTYGNASFEICLDEPATIPSPPITGYRVQTSTNGEDFESVMTGAASWVTTSPTCTGGKKSYTVTDLGSGQAPVNGTEYTVLVSATTTSVATASEDRSYGQDSASSTVTPRTTPGAAASLSAAVNGSESVLVSWTAPADTGGSAITGYGLRYQPSGGGWTTYGGALGASDTAASVTGLTAGTLYTFELTPNNAVGGGTASTATARAIAPPLPATVTSPQAASTVSSLSVEFLYVTGTARPVTSASVIAVPTSGSTVTQSIDLATQCSLGSCSSLVNGISGGTTYAVTVRLSNAAGDTDVTVANVAVMASSGGGESGTGGGNSGSAPSDGGSGDGGSSAPPGEATQPERGSYPSRGDGLTPDDASNGCLLAELCDGFTSEDGEVQTPGGEVLLPVDDTSRWPDLPTTAQDPVTENGSEQSLVLATSIPASAVSVSWQRPDDNSSAGYLLQLRRYGATEWTTFEVSQPEVDVQIAARGYVFEARVLRNSDFSLVASSGRFGVPLRKGEKLEMGSEFLRAQYPQTTVVDSPASWGGSVLMLEGPSTTAQFAMKGKSVNIWHPVGPDLGRATVLVDGIPKIELDEDRDYVGADQTSIKGLSKGRHVVTVVTQRTGSVGIDAIAGTPQCGTSCAVSPRSMLLARRTKDGIVVSRKSATTVAFAAKAVTVSVPGGLAGITWYLDGKPLGMESKRVTYRGNSVILTGLSNSTHVLVAVPSEDHEGLGGATAFGR